MTTSEHLDSAVLKDRVLWIFQLLEAMEAFLLLLLLFLLHLLLFPLSFLLLFLFFGLS